MFIVVGLVDQGFVSVLTIFSILVSSETESFVFVVSTFLDVALVLGDWAGQFVIIIGASFGNVLDGAVAAVACSLLDLGLFFDGGNNCFSYVARRKVSIDSAGFLVDQVVVSKSIVSLYARAGNTFVVEDFIVDGISVEVLASLVDIAFEIWIEWVLFLQEFIFNCVDSRGGEWFSELWIVDRVKVVWNIIINIIRVSLGFGDLVWSVSIWAGLPSWRTSIAGGYGPNK